MRVIVILVVLGLLAGCAGISDRYARDQQYRARIDTIIDFCDITPGTP